MVYGQLQFNLPPFKGSLHITWPKISIYINSSFNPNGYQSAWTDQTCQALCWFHSSHKMRFYTYKGMWNMTRSCRWIWWKVSSCFERMRRVEKLCSTESRLEIANLSGISPIPKKCTQILISMIKTNIYI